MASATQSSGNNTLTIVLAVIIIAILAVGAVFLMQDNRSGSERVGDAVQALPNGVDNAADKLGDQSPAENVERNVEKAVN
ncbi:hypothetical protein ABI_40160 [Asticcacaulis biprosthecium C19]|uniref:Uncharacterized protein n=1 Tax=Asticcacaulis biprosthecium C19 TaxID=715226 RepID=F4QS79_9CAUL|nr:hypothetical protein [Asticcacaulis biprosthecium]EGF89599.1 hypothetical protein ABI_40160 [Asticcacaulis biprosthecium C19]